MERRIPDPMNNTFYVYRRSNVELTEHDKPTGITYRPDGPSEIRATHLIICGLSDEWEIGLAPPHRANVPGNPNNPIWFCVCCPLLGGIVAVGNPTKYINPPNG